MKTEKKKVGDGGEALAASFLVKNGYTILERNLHISHKEVDIIAEDDDTVVFVEVKTYNSECGDGLYRRPSENVSYDKKRFMLSAMKTYIKTHPIDKRPRIDVIEVYLAERDSAKQINHIRNAITQ